MPCASAVQFSGLKAGKHTFTAWAIDAAGNRSIPFIYSWKIVAAAASSLTSGGSVLRGPTLLGIHP